MKEEKEKNSEWQIWDCASICTLLLSMNNLHPHFPELQIFMVHSSILSSCFFPICCSCSCRAIFHFTSFLPSNNNIKRPQTLLSCSHKKGKSLKRSIFNQSLAAGTQFLLLHLRNFHQFLKNFRNMYFFKNE